VLSSPVAQCVFTHFWMDQIPNLCFSLILSSHVYLTLFCTCKSTIFVVCHLSLLTVSLEA